MELYSEISSFTIKSFINSLGKLNEYYAHGLWQLWEEMGCDQGSIGVLRPKAVLDCVRERFEDMMAEENNHKNNLIDRINDNYLKLGSLSAELGESFVEPPVDLALVQLEKALRTILEGFKEKKAVRLTELHKIHKQNKDLADLLGEGPFPISITNIPSDQEQKSLTNHTQELSETRIQRLKRLASLKSTIIDLLDELGIEPRSQFERTIVCESDESFLPLSEEQLTRVVEVRDGLFKEKSKKIKEAEAMRTFIRDVSKKLQSDSRAVESFLKEFSGYSQNELSELQFRVDELELLKREHLERYISSCREELIDLWDKCYYSEEQRALFNAFFITEGSDALLEEYENEIEGLKAYYTANEAMFAMVQQRQELWNKKLELEARAKDPNRFKVKSTEFLKEERERKNVESQLPKIERSLEDAIEKHEFTSGKEFLVGGIPYQAFMRHQAAEYERKRDKQRMESKKKQLEGKSKYGVSSSNFNSTKRKATPSTINSNISKKHKAESNEGSSYFTKSSIRSNLTRSASLKVTSSRYLSSSKSTSRLNPHSASPDNSFVQGFPVLNMKFCNLKDANPFLNPKDINANSTMYPDKKPTRYNSESEAKSSRNDLRDTGRRKK